MVLAFGDHRLDIKRRELRRGTELIDLEPKVFDLLAFLVQNRDRVVSKDDLLREVWGGLIVSESALTTRINAVRRALGDDGTAQRLVRTFNRKGIRFVGEATEISDPAAPAPDGTPAEPPTAADMPSGAREITQPLIDNHKFWSRANAIGAATGILCILALIAATANWYSPWFTTTIYVPPRLSFAVLPFTILGVHEQQLANAITQDVTTDLSQADDMLVISYSIATAYHDNKLNAAQIGRKLRVRYIVKGTVQRMGNLTRVNVLLIDAQTNAHLWADRFDEAIDDIVLLQNELRKRIVGAITANIVAMAAREPTEKPDAIDYIIKGRAIRLSPVNADNRAKAVDMFERALALDPSSVSARLYLAQELIGLGISRLGLRQDFARGRRLVEEASAAAPDSSLARLLKGRISEIEGRCKEAIVEWTKILSSNHAAAAYGAIGGCKLWLGELNAAIMFEEKAIGLSTRENPTQWLFYWRIAVAYLLQSRVDQALEALERANAQNPKVGDVHVLMAAAYGLKGENDRATAELLEARRLLANLPNPGPERQRYSSIVHLKDSLFWKALRIATGPELLDATVFAGLRNAGMPER